MTDKQKKGYRKDIHQIVPGATSGEMMLLIQLMRCVFMDGEIAAIARQQAALDVQLAKTRWSIACQQAALDVQLAKTREAPK